MIPTDLTDSAYFAFGGIYNCWHSLAYIQYTSKLGVDIHLFFIWSVIIFVLLAQKTNITTNQMKFWGLWGWCFTCLYQMSVSHPHEKKIKRLCNMKQGAKFIVYIRQ